MKALRYLLVSICLAALPAAGSAEVRRIAVVVNPDNPTRELSLTEVRKIFRLEKQRWPSGKKIQLLMHEQGSSEKQIALRTVYQMTDEQLRDYWLRKVADLDPSVFPRAWSSNAAVKLVVGRYSHAIGFIDASEVDDSVKVVRIDGLDPSSQNYPLTARVE